MKKFNKISVVSLLILILSFTVVRYAVFGIHGMKQLPLVLGLLIAVELIVLCFTKVKIVPLISAISYPLGFAIGCLFQISGLDAGGGATNNLWIIWIGTIFVMNIISVFAELINRKKAKQQ